MWLYLEQQWENMQASCSGWSPFAQQHAGVLYAQSLYVILEDQICIVTDYLLNALSSGPSNRLDENITQLLKI
jgi:hypothetical protein